MSNASLIDVGICPPPSLKIRAHRIHSCTDIQFDRDLIGILRLNGNIPPGPIRTFLHTDGAGLIAWKTFDQEDIPAGDDGDYLQTIAGLVQWAPPTFAPAAIAPGTARQLLQTNTAATAAEWTSNVDIPGTLDVTGNAVFDADLTVTDTVNVLNGDLNLLTGDLDITSGGITIDTGDIDVSTGDVRIVGDLSLGGNLSLNAVSGSVGQVIRKTGATTQTWANVTAGDLAPGTANQVLQTDPTGTTVVWNSNVVVPGTISTSFNITGGTVQSIGAINSVNGGLTLSNVAAQINMAGASTQINCGGTTTTQTLNTVGDMRFNGVSGTTGQILKKTGAATQAFSDLAAADIKGGTLNQVLQSDGTNAVFNTNVTIPGTLTATAGSSLGGVIQLGGITASLGMVPVSNGSGIPTWSYPTYFARYYDSNIVNMNSGGGTTLLTAATADVSNSNITYLAGTFTLAEAGHYQVIFQTNPTSASAKAQSYIKVIVNGTSIGSMLNASAALNDVQSISLIKSFRVNTTNTTVAITTQQFVAGTLNTSGADVNGIATTLITITRLGPYV